MFFSMYVQIFFLISSLELYFVYAWVVQKKPESRETRWPDHANTEHNTLMSLWDVLYTVWYYLCVFYVMRHFYLYKL